MKKALIVALIIFVIIFGYLFYLLKFAKHYPSNIDLVYKEDYFGITFSKKFAAELGMDWKEVYKAVLDDLKPKYIRIPVYWDETEQTKDEFDFHDYDYIFDEGKKHDVNFIAVIGWRIPRWPECHAPKWLKDAETSDTQERALIMLEKTVNHFKDRDEIQYWQVENEPLMDFFGECPNGDYEFLKKEVELVRKLDSRKIIVTSSGELTGWDREAKIADIFGTTLYRVVWNPWFRYSRYPFPASFYGWKADLYEIPKENRMIMELQLEPWSPEGSLTELTQKEMTKSMNIEQFQANIQFAINVDFAQTYLWGVEWWYWEYKHGEPQYWEIAKTLF